VALRLPSSSLLGEALSLLRAAAKRTTAFSLLVNLVAAFATAGILAAAGKLLGELADEPTWDAALPWLSLAGACLAISMIAEHVHAGLTQLAAEQVQSHAVGRVLRAASSVPYASFDTPAFYDRLRRAHESGSDHAWAIVQSSLNLLRGIFDMIAIIVVLAFVAPVLIAVAMVAYIPMWIVTVVNNRVHYKFSWEETEGDRRRSYIESLLTDRRSAKEVRSFELEDELVNQFSTIWTERLERLAGVVKYTALRSGLASLVSAILVVASLGIVVWLTIEGDLSLDQAGVGVLGVRQLSNGVTRTGNYVDALHHSGRFLRDYEQFRNDAIELAPANDGPSAPTKISQVVVDNVGFVYPGSTEPALRGVSMTMRAGEVTAIVGANGSGKTTLLTLLAGLYLPTSGSIRWDSQETADFSVRERQRAIAPLFQDFTQFHFSVRENISLTDADSTRLRTALELADINFIDELPDGLETQLGKAFADGTELSIGQWQRLALARALYRDAPILLLDEPASALDPGAEARLVGRLRRTYSDRCVIMISHRFASVRQADRIYVVDEGRIIEQGSHAELMKRAGAYRGLYQAQAEPLLAHELKDQPSNQP